MSEHDEQAAFVYWAELLSWKYPDLLMLFAIPNGGMRSVSVGVALKKEGVKKGVPDMFLAVPRGQYSGLFLEFKYGKGRLSPEQIWWSEKLTEKRYLCVVPFSFEQARDATLAYLSLPTLK